MRKTKKRPLSLNKEYLRLLNARDLSEARGGVPRDTTSSWYVCERTDCYCPGE
jgi:hypothetical protein